MVQIFDEGKSTIGIIMDLNKAFDTLDRSILLGEHNRYGIDGLASFWLYSFCAGISQYVCVY